MDEALQQLILCKTKEEQNQSLRTLLSMDYNSKDVRESLDSCSNEKSCQLIRRFIQHTTVKAFHEGRYTVETRPEPVVLSRMEMHGGGTQSFIYDTEVATGGCRKFAETKIKVRNLNHPLDILDDPEYATPAEDIRPPALVNISNPTQPGGGYSRGNKGFEEDFCRRTNLYSGLHDPQKKYSKYKKWSYPLSQNQIVANTSVTVIRNGCSDGYSFRAPYGQLLVFSTPLPSVDKKGMPTLSAFTRAMRTLLTVSAKYSVRTLVLPFFHKEIEDAARALSNLITNESTYKGLVQNIVLVPENETTATRLNDFFVKRNDPGIERIKQKRSLELPGDKNSTNSGRATVVKRPKNDTSQRLNMANRYAEGLKTDKGADPDTAERLGSEIEIAMFDHFKGNLNGKAFMTHFREVLTALRCPKNSVLRNQILSGSLLPTTIPTMSSKAFLNPDQQLKQQEIMEEVTADLTAGTTVETETSMYLCTRCKKRRCTYYELQTRSGDEPMTQFISCLNCGKKWII
eukprot:TRINITY_DN17122_c0_g1_i1.p1 TRINITY_DN17122_c0_g1~~TRINITY_DN17122_c0_g1_i1.p1  ORF type:complete len:515 (+),score=49.39 TRINITY_DN17122_c0_g1_i1:108-1652(+)